MKKSQRERSITKVSVVGIVSNGLLGVVKVIIGLMTNSIAIITDAVNNLTDTSSSVITIIGTHLATRHPDAKHPFGYGRIEYLTSLLIGLIVLFTGFELCKSSVESILHPKQVRYDLAAAIILGVTVVVKIFLGQYTLRAGRKYDSEALKASGMDARSDAVATLATLFAVLFYFWRHISIDAWVGALISLYIVRTGYEILRSTVSKIVGEAVSPDLAKKIYARVLQVPIVKGAYDLMLNNYGPDYYIGSINVEVDHTMTAEEICRTLHPAQTDILKQFRTQLVFGLYAIDSKSPYAPRTKELMRDFCKGHKGCRGFHGLFVDSETHEIYCDIVVDYGIDHDSIADELTGYLTREMPGFTPIVTVDSPSQ